MHKLSFALRNPNQHSSRTAVIGSVLLIPALLLVCGGILQSLFGITGLNDALNFKLFLFHPTIILGGLLLALALNLLAVMRIGYQHGALIGTLQMRGHLLNLALIAFIGVLLATIFLYLLVENFQIVPR